MTGPRLPAMSVRDQDWMSHGTCIGHVDPDLWFREDVESQHEARSICVLRCPVRSQCVAFALLQEAGQKRADRDGTRGGMSDLERWHADPTATAKTPLDGPKPDENAPCGRYTKLLYHLLRGQHVDHVCWKAELDRQRARVRKAQVALALAQSHTSATKAP